MAVKVIARAVWVWYKLEFELDVEEGVVQARIDNTKTISIDNNRIWFFIFSSGISSDHLPDIDIFYGRQFQLCVPDVSFKLLIF
jgi:hypothetical protein